MKNFPGVFAKKLNKKTDLLFESKLDTLIACAGTNDLMKEVNSLNFLKKKKKLEKYNEISPCTELDFPEIILKNIRSLNKSLKDLNWSMRGFWNQNNNNNNNNNNNRLGS